MSKVQGTTFLFTLLVFYNKLINIIFTEYQQNTLFF